MTRLGLAIVAGCQSSIVLYAFLRCLQATLGKEPDPALVIWTEHSGFFWRVWTVGFVGVALAFATFVLAGRHETAVARVLAKTVWVAAAIIGLQGLLLP